MLFHVTVTKLILLILLVLLTISYHVSLLLLLLYFLTTVLLLLLVHSTHPRLLRRSLGHPARALGHPAPRSLPESSPPRPRLCWGARPAPKPFRGVGHSEWAPRPRLSGRPRAPRPTPPGLGHPAPGLGHPEASPKGFGHFSGTPAPRPRASGTPPEALGTPPEALGHPARGPRAPRPRPRAPARGPRAPRTPPEALGHTARGPGTPTTPRAPRPRPRPPARGPRAPRPRPRHPDEASRPRGARGPRAPRPRPRAPARGPRAPRPRPSGTPPEASATLPEALGHPARGPGTPPEPSSSRGLGHPARALSLGHPAQSPRAPEGPTASNTPPEGLAHTARRASGGVRGPQANSRKVSGTLPDASALGHPEASGRPDRCPTTPSELAMPEPSTSSVILSLPLLHY